MPLRVACDLDGVLADMEGELLRQARIVFGDTAAAEVTPPANLATSDTPPEGSATEPLDDDARLAKRQITPRQQRRLWRHVGTIENFWESLQEIEPGAVRKLAEVATARRWEVIFLTKRPRSAGATSQLQTQRWLEAQGFRLPSVFVVQGSRGRIAAALNLDFVIDDTPENCLDVVVDSKARAILVWRDDATPPPAAASRLGIGVVRSVDECLKILSEFDAPAAEKPNVMDRVMRLLGLKEPAKA